MNQIYMSLVCQGPLPPDLYLQLRMDWATIQAPHICLWHAEIKWPQASAMPSSDSHDMMTALNLNLDSPQS